MQDFREMANRGVRFALENDLTSRGSMVKFGQSMAKEYHVNGAHAQTAMGYAHRGLSMRAIDVIFLRH